MSEKKANKKGKEIKINSEQTTPEKLNAVKESVDKTRIEAKQRQEQMSEDIRREKQERAQRCLQRVNAILAEENCQMIAQASFTEGRNPQYACLIVAKNLQ